MAIDVRGLPIEVRSWGRAGPRLVHKSRGVANGNEGLGAWQALALSIKARYEERQAGPGPVDKSERFGGLGGPGPNLSVDSTPVLFPIWIQN